MSKEIRTYKLTTGEEIIGTVVEIPNLHPMRETDGKIRLEKIRIVHMVQTGPQQIGVGLAPFSAANLDGTVVFERGAILATIEHSTELENAYLQQTSGIQIAGAGSFPTR